MLALALQPFLLTGPAGFGLRLSTTVAVYANTKYEGHTSALPLL